MYINPMSPGHVNPYPYMARAEAAPPQASGLNVLDANQVDPSGCQTCQNRMYVDVSDDGGVSFQAPTRLSPSQAATAVAAHEGEHAARESARATQEGRIVLANTIQIFTATCPECGTSYVSGGQTRTTTAAVVERAHVHEVAEYEDDVGGWLDVSV